MVFGVLLRRYLFVLKCGLIDDLICKTETETQMWRTDVWIPRRKQRVRQIGRLTCVYTHTHTHTHTHTRIYKVGK